MPIILLIALILGGGTSLAAQSSLPGSALYPVKVNVNENIQAFLSFGAEGSANVQADQAINRLEEAAELSASGELTVEARAELKENFQVHAENVQKQIAELEANGEAEAAAEIRADFEAALEARESILLDLGTSLAVLKTQATSTGGMNTDVKTGATTTIETKGGTTSIKSDTKVETGVKVDLGL